jgi:hypothetical protein
MEHSPAHLPFGVVHITNSLLNDLQAPGLGIEEMTGFKKNARRVRILDHPAFGAVVFVLRDGPRTIFQLDQPVPGVVRDLAVLPLAAVIPINRFAVVDSRRARARGGNGMVDARRSQQTTVGVLSRRPPYVGSLGEIVVGRERPGG